jgi:hypothetical protein
MSWFKEIRTLSMTTLVNQVLREDLLIESLMFSHEIEDVHVDYSQRASDLVVKIRETNNQILNAETENEASTAEVRLRLFGKEYHKIINLAKKAAVKCLLSGRFFAVAHMGDDTVIVPSRSWVGKIDWEEEKLIFEQREYSNIRIIAYEQLTPEQCKLVHQFAEEGIDAQSDKTEGPGRPSSGMHLIEQKLRERAKNDELKDSLNEESRILEEWFKRIRPDKRPITAKTIANKQRSLYRELRGKAA